METETMPRARAPAHATSALGDSREARKRSNHPTIQGNKAVGCDGLRSRRRHVAARVWHEQLAQHIVLGVVLARLVNRRVVVIRGGIVCVACEVDGSQRNGRVAAVGKAKVGAAECHVDGQRRVPGLQNLRGFVRSTSCRSCERRGLVARACVHG
jgi:hypothetical protein